MLCMRGKLKIMSTLLGTQKTQTCYLALGSNLHNPQQQIEKACEEIANLPHSSPNKISRIYKNPPYGTIPQADFFNAVMSIQTRLPPHELLRHLQEIEIKQGRVRGLEKWGPRTLDLDILLYGNEVISDKTLQIPHYDLKNRFFFLYPLHEIIPDLTLPNGETIYDLLQQCEKTTLVPL